MSTACGFSYEHKFLYFQLSSTVSVLYFTIYVIITFIVSIYALLHNSSLYIDVNRDHNKLSTLNKCRPYVKCYAFLLLHFAIQSINIGIIIQYYYIATTKCDHHIPPSSLNIEGLFLVSFGILLIYRIISTFKIYSMTHSICACLVQFLFDFCIIKSLFVELTKYKIIGHRKHYMHLCYCFQWFMRIQAYFHAAPMAYIQLVAVLLFFTFAQPSEYNPYYIPILISLMLCTINVIAIAFESDSSVFTPHLFNVSKIYFFRLLFRILDISLRLISLALCWVMLGGYFVIFITFCEALYIFISCVRLQLIHKGVLGRNSSIMSPSSQPHFSSKSSLSKKVTIRTSTGFSSREYTYRPNSIGRLIIGDLNHNDLEATPDTSTPTGHGRESVSPKQKSMCGHILLRIFDYYIHGMFIILISFRFEDRSSGFARWFWRLRVLQNIVLMSVITVFGYMRLWCPYVCFHGQPYDVSFIELNADDYHIGFILFVYGWFACIALPILFIYLATGKIKTDKYSPQSLDDVMINGDIVGILELDIFGVFKRKKDILRQTVYTLTACNLNWMEVNSDILMQYLHLLSCAHVNLDEVCDPYDCHNTLINQLCRNQRDSYHWFKMKQITDLLHDDCGEIIASCCSCGNFRIFKHIIKHFGHQYLRENALLALHYAFRCQGTKAQQQQANRIIVYILKNTTCTMQDFMQSYDDEHEKHVITRMIKSKYANIQQIKRASEKKKHALKEEDDHDDRAQLLQLQLSNNSIHTIELNEIAESDSYKE
eukprot:89602_1